MCLAIPSKIVEGDNSRAMADVYGARREINLMLMPEEVGIGDYVLVHAGFAIQKVEHESAHEALSVISALLEDAEKEIASGDEGREFYG